MLKFVKRNRFYLILAVILVVGLMYRQKEMFGEDAGNPFTNPDLYKYERRLNEVKIEHSEKIDGQSQQDTNKPYEQAKMDGRGWFSEGAACLNTPDIYCKPKNKWIFPY